MSLFQQAMTRCDDCDAKKPLRWFGQHIRICEDCRKAREDAVPPTNPEDGGA